MKALVHSGGAAKGAYGAGVIKYLLGDLGIQYSSLHGVSVGAINCAFISQFENGKEKEASEQLYDLWSKLDISKILKRWFPFGKVHAAWKMSFFDSSPLQELIKNNVSLEKIRKVNRKINVGAVSLTSGKYTIFTQDDDDFIAAILASSAFPGVFCPVKIKDQLWIDGGLKELSPIRAAIEAGADEIDVITTSPETRIKMFIEKPSILDVFKRAVDLATDKILSNDIDRAFMYNKLAAAGISDKKVVKLNIIRPKYNLTEDLLDFSPQKIAKMMELGYQDAKTTYKI
jgi:NTE family protein